MILVSLGTHERPFIRLVKEIERLIKEKKIKEKVIMQLGYTKYNIKGAKCFDFIEFDKMRQYIKNCRIMITHGGVGSIIDSLSFGKPTIVVPRRKTKNLDEHTDEHQVQITKLLAKEGKIIPVFDISDLEVAIKESGKQKVIKLGHRKSKILDIIDKKFKEWRFLN